MGGLVTQHAGPAAEVAPSYLASMRRAIMVSPPMAVRVLQRRAGGGGVPSGAVHTLLAEALLRAGRAEEAFDAALIAAGAGDSATLRAGAVLADLSCWVGEPSSPVACDLYGQLADQLGDTAHGVNAQAMRAAAVYQQTSCVHGREALDQLTADCRVRGGPVFGMLAAAQQAMAEGCTIVGDRRVPGGWAPVPGGYLCPVETPWPSYLASRVLRHPAVHVCRAQPRLPTSPTAGGRGVL